MNTALRVIRILCVIVFVSGIAGLIISSIAGNNVGVVTTIGLITSLAAVVLLTAKFQPARVATVRMAPVSRHSLLV